jgi:hypothetical protein
MAQSLRTMTLRIAARRLGGRRKLRQLLGVPSRDIALWFSGIAEPPMHVFLRALESVLDDLDAAGRVRPSLKVLPKPGRAE